MKCWVIVVNRGRGRLSKRATFEASAGKIKKGFRNSYGFFIPDSAVPIEMEKGRGTMPLWIVNEKTSQALTLLTVTKGAILKTGEETDAITVKEETDNQAHTKMNLLIKREFWKQVAQKLKLGTFETLIYLGAGYGFVRILEFFIVNAFGPK